MDGLPELAFYAVGMLGLFFIFTVLNGGPEGRA